MDTFRTVDFTPGKMFPFTGLFHRSISMSGTATCPWALTPKGRAKVLAQQVAGLFECPAHPSKDLISCLRKKDAYKLYSADRAIKVSGHRHAEYNMKLNSNKTNNYQEHHSWSASTNWPAYIDFKYSAWKNEVFDFTKLITSQKQRGSSWAILHYTHTAVRHDIFKN